MKVLILLILCVGAALASSVPRQEKPNFDLDDAHNHFKTFMQTHNKQYASEEEKQMRFEIFKENLMDINKKNTDPNEHAVFGLTRFVDLTKDEFRKMYTGFVPRPIDPNMLVNVTGPASGNAPDSFDWREKNVVTGVKNQGQCGSCWAFSSTGNIEGQYAIKHGQLLEFSEQQLVDCDQTNSGCNGGYMTKAFESLMQMGGIESESDYPYYGTQSTCQFDISKVQAVVTQSVPLNLQDEDQLMDLLSSKGPISIVVAAETWSSYNGGIYSNCPADRLNHAVLLVGYGSENGVPYWIIKNSWAESWGESGYIRLQRGGNTCGMMNAEAGTAEVQ